MILTTLQSCRRSVKEMRRRANFNPASGTEQDVTISSTRQRSKRMQHEKREKRRQAERATCKKENWLKSRRVGKKTAGTSKMKIHPHHLAGIKQQGMQVL